MKYIVAITLLFLLGSRVNAQNICEGALPICTNSSNYYPLGYEIDSTNTSIDYSCAPDSLNQHWYTFITTGNGDVNLTAFSSMGGNISMLIFGPTTATATSPCMSYSIPDYCSPNGQTHSFSDTGVPANSVYHVLILNHSDTTNEVAFSLSGAAVNNNCPTSVLNCSAATAQYQANYNGQSNQANKMCFTDTLSIQYQSNGSYPPEITSISSVLPHNPGTLFFLYWKQPDNFLPPVLDPGLVGPIPGSDVDFDIINNLDIQNLFAQYPFLNNTLYLKAFPCYNTDSAYVAHYCYDESSPTIMVQMYDEITIDTLSIDCAMNTAEVDFEGGSPDFNAGYLYNFINVSGTTPPGFYLNPSSFDAATPTTMYNLPDTLGPVVFDIEDDMGCKKQFSGLFGAPLPNYSYADTSFCDNVGAIIPTINIPPAADLYFLAYDNVNGSTIPIGSNNGIINAQGLAGSSITVDLTASYLGCSRDSAFSFTIYPAPQIDSLPDISVCPGDSVSFEFTSSTSSNLSYFWNNDNPSTGIPASGSGTNFSQGNFIVPFPDPAISTLNYWGDNSTCSSDTLTLLIELLPGINASPDTAVCKGEEVTLQVEGGSSYTWTPSDQLSSANSNDPVATINEGQVIVVKGLTMDNCTTVDSVFLELLGVEECVERPFSAFSPNGDGVNDNWTIPGIEEFPDNKVFIYNRWGDIIVQFENYDNLNVVWDGTNKNGEELSAGTFFYIVEYENAENLSGWVELLK